MIDFIIKLGGSILYDIETTKILLNNLAKCKLKAVYIIGSGKFGESFKEVFHPNELNLSNEIASNCWSNIQSINANIISSLNPDFILCDSQNEIYAAIEKGKSPIINTIFFRNLFNNLRYQTVDVRSSVLCNKMNCKRLVILTDVNGIFNEDPKKKHDAIKIQSIKAVDLKEKGRTSVDIGFAEKLIEYNITGYVIGYKEYSESKLDLNKYLETNATIIYP